MFSRRSAIVMVWFVTAICGFSILATSVPDDGYLRAFGWGVVTAGVVFLMGRLGVWLFWEQNEDKSDRV